LTEHVKEGWKIEKSGYIYVFTNNESADAEVTFEELGVTSIQGPLLEVGHYYPFGLSILGISSRADGRLRNREMFNGGCELQSELFSDGSGIDWYDANFRTYDPQIGQFRQIDALADLASVNSPYVFGSNNPIAINDPLGLQDNELTPVTVTGYIKNTWKSIRNFFTLQENTSGYKGTGWGHSPRRWMAEKLNLGHTASNLVELGLHSQLQSSQVSLTGGLLAKAKSAPDMLAFQNQIIALAKSDPRFKKLAFVLKGRDVREFGGKRWSSTNESWSALNSNNPLLHEETLSVAANPLTWSLRHASVSYTAAVKADGTMVISYHLSDTLDLSAQNGRSEAYNNISNASGFLYHDVVGGNSSMQVNADWSTVVK
jgi:RHS repeat-associated protein